MISWTVALIIIVVAALMHFAKSFTNEVPEPDDINFRRIYGRGSVIALIASVVLFGVACMKPIDPGHQGVATLFGKVQLQSYEAGLHFANPMYEWTMYDCRQKTHKETAGVPSADQLITSVDVSVQYKVNRAMVSKMLEETGTTEQVIAVHMIPLLRSVLREQGKGVERAEDFYKMEVQQRLQESLQIALSTSLTAKGIEIQQVLLRDIKLPEAVRAGVLAKKQRDQAAEKEVAELRRFKTEQQKKVEIASAELQAAQKDAEKVKTLADARAYEILAINKAVQNNPAYIQLEAIKAMQKISENPASQIYFINSDSPTPLPLMHIGAAGGSRPPVPTAPAVAEKK